MCEYNCENMMQVMLSNMYSSLTIFTAADGELTWYCVDGMSWLPDGMLFYTKPVDGTLRVFVPQLTTYNPIAQDHLASDQAQYMEEFNANRSEFYEEAELQSAIADTSYDAASGVFNFNIAFYNGPDNPGIFGPYMWYSGIDGLIPSSFDADEPIAHTHRMPLSKAVSKYNKSLLLDDATYRVVAALVDCETGSVVNVAQCDISDPVGMDALQAPADQAPVYSDLTGQRVADSSHGIFVKVQGARASKVRL